MNYKLFALLGLCFFLLNNCNNSETKDGKIEHPQEQYIPSGEQTIIISDEKSNDTTFESYVNRLRTKGQFAQMGKKQGEENEMFGRIGGVVTDDKGRIYVLDERNKQVKVFNERNGEFQFVLGRGGEGPGEFQSPTDIDLDQNGNIYIADRSNAVHVFHQVQEKYEYDTTIRIHFVPDSFCILNDKMYIRAVGLNRNYNSTQFNVIHKYELPDGRYLESFGQPYQSPNTFAKKQLSDGILACNQKSNTVTSTFDGMPYLFTYDTSGNLEWKAKIEPFQTRPVIETNQGGSPSITLEGTDYPVDAIEFLTPIKGSELFFTQLIHSPTKKGAPMSEINVKTFLISGKDGSSSYLGEQINPINAATPKRILTNAMLDSLYPNIVTYNY